MYLYYMPFDTIMKRACVAIILTISISFFVDNTIVTYNDFFTNMLYYSIIFNGYICIIYDIRCVHITGDGDIIYTRPIIAIEKCIGNMKNGIKTKHI